jgi:competence protein ComEC
VGNLLLVPLVDLMVISGNVLPIVYMFPKIFDFCSYLNLVIIKIFDCMLELIDKISLPIFYGNENAVFFYLILILSFYFVRKGYKKFVYLPLICIFVIGIQVYSPIPKVKYYKEGAILVSYEWERILLVNKSQIDMKRLLKITSATKAYRNEKSININGICNIKIQGKDYILETLKEKYLLKMANGEKALKEYDIINFKDGAVNEIFIINGSVIKA